MELKFEEIEQTGEENYFKSNTFDHPENNEEAHITINYNRMNDEWVGVIKLESWSQGRKFTDGHESVESVKEKIDEFAQEAGIK